MAKLESVENVGVTVRNLKNAKQFYTQKVGLALRDEMKKFGYLALGATKGGQDADLNLWQPDPSWGAEMYEAGLIRPASDGSRTRTATSCLSWSPRR